MKFREIPDLETMEYRSTEFSDLYETDRGRAIWRFMKRWDNLIRMETAAFLDRPIVEPLVPHLHEKFEISTADIRMMQMVSDMAEKITEEIGEDLKHIKFVVGPQGSRESKQSRQKSGNDKVSFSQVMPEESASWTEDITPTQFDEWLDRRVTHVDGSLDLDQLYAIARDYGIEDRYDHLDRDAQRVKIGKMLKDVVPESEVDSDEHSMFEQRLFRLNDAEWQAFCDLLDRPATFRPELAKLLAEKSVLE